MKSVFRLFSPLDKYFGSRRFHSLIFRAIIFSPTVVVLYYFLVLELPMPLSPLPAMIFVVGLVSDELSTVKVFRFDRAFFFRNELGPIARGMTARFGYNTRTVAVRWLFEILTVISFGIVVSLYFEDYLFESVSILLLALGVSHCSASINNTLVFRKLRNKKQQPIEGNDLHLI